MRRFQVPRHIIWIAGVIVSMIGLMTAFQNCAQQPLDEGSKNVSPFSGDKIQISPALQANLSKTGQLEDNTELPIGSNFVIVISESCLKARKAASPDSYTSYFAHKYLPDDIYTRPAADFDQAAVKISLRRLLKFADLKRAVRRDSCIIGLADSQNHKVDVSVFTDPESSQQTYLNDLSFESSSSFFKTNITASAKVNLAIIDTGYDLQSPDRVPLVANTDGADFTVAFGNRYLLSNNIQDEQGHGTSIAHLIAAPQNTVGVVGLTMGAADILPIKLLKGTSAKIDSYILFDAIKRAVNGHAEVVNLSFASLGTCDPVLGQAILYAIERGVFFSIAAGNGLTGDDLSGYVPGEIISPTDNGTVKQVTYATPACWGRYFKGAVTVGALQTGTQQRASFSNYGLDGVEIAAPGTGLRVMGKAGVMANVDGTSFAAPQVAAAAALIIAYHKSKGWPFTPWLIEDILMNASPSVSALASSPTGFRRGKILNFQSIANYLQVLSTKTADERRREPSDNSENGAGFTPSGETAGGGQILALEVYAKRPYVRVGDRIQLQTVAYYSNGSYQVVTESATYSSNVPSLVSIDSKGVGYAATTSGAMGGVTVSASFGGKTAYTYLTVGNYDATTGMNAELESLSASISQVNVSPGYDQYMLKVFGKYQDGSVREVTVQSSFASDKTGIYILPANGKAPVGLCMAKGGENYNITSMYRGQRVTVPFKSPLNPVTAITVSVNDVNGGALKNGKVFPGQVLSLRAFFDSNQVDYCFQNLKFSSADPTVHAVVSKWVPSSSWGHVANAPSVGIPIGRHTITVTADYTGGSSPVVLKKDFVLEVADDPIIGLKAALYDLSFGAGQPITYVLTHQSGSEEVVTNNGDVEQTFFDLGGAEMPLIWPHPTLNSLFVYGVKGGDQVVLKAKWKAKPTLTYQATLPVKARGAYVGSLKDTPVVAKTPYPSPAANDARCTSAAQAASPFATGQGSSASPYLICSVSQLLGISQLTPAAGSTTYFELGANLDLQGESNIVRKRVIFKGASVLIGSGHELSNITSLDPELDLVSVFTSTEPLEVRGLLMRGLNIEGQNYVGIFAPSALNKLIKLKVTQSYFKDISVRSSNITGGVVGYAMEVNLDRVFFSAATVTGNYMTGGLIGSAAGTGTVSNCGFEGVVQSSLATAGTFMGGLIGNSNAVVSSSYFEGRVKGTNFVGGLSGSSSFVVNNRVQADVVGSGTGVGGIVAQAYFGFDQDRPNVYYGNSFIGNVWGASEVGGIAGSGRDSIIENSTFKGTVYCDQLCGGVVGRIYGISWMRNVNADVNVSGASPIGSLVGKYDPLMNPKTSKSPSPIFEATNVVVPSGSTLKPIGDLRGTGPAGM